MARSLTLDVHRDTDPPVIGDVLTTARAAYTILGVDPVDSRVWPHRFRLSLRRLDSGCNAEPPVVPDGATLHKSFAYQPGDRPRDYFGEP